MPSKEYEGHRKSLRERFLRGVFSGFADHEIVELILTLCTQRRDVKKQVKMLLRKFGSIIGIFYADLSELKSVEGIREVAAVAIEIVRASTNLYLRERIETNQRLDESGKLRKFWKNRMRRLRFEEIGHGSASCVHVDLRKIFEIALSRHASCIIFAHHHPCGDTRPSDTDECITRKAKAAAELLEITLVDLIIISKVNEFSFRDRGLVI
ncbi:MAG: hypothetical protein LBS87_02480 [Puniceicoccales bacterium]|jgi:DNA repair protein RadC|nr:hypothetical protein [Puniceicoccales bacterium]